MKIHSRYSVARKILIMICLFIAIGAVAGSIGMLSAIDGSNMGMQPLLPYFQVLPFADVLFQNFLFPGIALLLVNGLPNLIAAVLMIRNQKSGVICGTIFGLTLMAWITIQFIIFPFNWLSTSYFLFGLIQLATGCAAWIFYNQEHFTVQEGDYPFIGTHPDRLVIYFSRMGYGKKAAFEEANHTGAEIFEIKSTERTQGTLGFWWCGRFGMHRWDMPIEGLPEKLDAFHHVTIVSPVWVFHLSAPMRSFCRAAKGKIHEADCILTHFQRARYANVAREIEALLGLKLTKAVSICVRQGRVIQNKAL